MAASDDPAFSLPGTAETVLDVIPGVWDRIRSTLRAAGTSRFGISLEQFHVLRHIRAGYCSVADLAAKRQVSRSAVSQAVDVLVARGLVRRSESSDDRRCTVLELTSRARQVLEENRATTRAWMEDQMAELSSADLETVTRAMAILEASFCRDGSR